MGYTIGPGIGFARNRKQSIIKQTLNKNEKYEKFNKPNQYFLNFRKNSARKSTFILEIYCLVDNFPQNYLFR